MRGREEERDKEIKKSRKKTTTKTYTLKKNNTKLDILIMSD